jgi:hypothetical protein
MEFSNPKLAARLFELCAVDIDVENMQRLAEALDTSIPAVAAIFTEAEDIARKQQ